LLQGPEEKFGFAGLAAGFMASSQDGSTMLLSGVRPQIVVQSAGDIQRYSQAA